MATKRIWIVRSGRGAAFVDEFLEQGIVAIGWGEVGPVDASMEDAEIDRRFQTTYPRTKPNARKVGAAQVKRFLRELSIDDTVATYDPARRLYYLGTIRSDPEWKDHELPRVRRVAWDRKVGRDQLSAGTRNKLGSIATLFLASQDASEELCAKAAPIGAEPSATVTPQSAASDGRSNALLREEVVEKGEQFIEDRIARLDWDEMQELVAGILRAMGYVTRVTPGGPDRGVDIFASPDGLGLQEPRIFVEVKHRTGNSIGAQDVRAFLGGRQRGDKCLFVSTGGFTKDAKYEAERSTVPITLVPLPDLRNLLVSHYDRVDATVKALVPLQKLYWPVE